MKIIIELTKQEAWDLAQFCKRSTFDMYRACAEDNDEAYRMIHAQGKVREALAEAGVSPR